MRTEAQLRDETPFAPRRRNAYYSHEYARRHRLVDPYPAPQVAFFGEGMIRMLIS